MLLPLPWHKGRVLLIGDAVHATTPHLASGAGIGLEDGIVIAEELDRASSVAEALQRYDQRRWERCRMVVQNSLRLGQIEIEGGSQQEHGELMRVSQEALAQPI
jgi:2-polyprenyl-6-methoxyphenol hydroxylase-like FAD-dependent oxidoreductase